MREKAACIVHAAQIAVLRWVPLPLPLKERVIWSLSPRYRLGVHVVIRDGYGRVLAVRSAYSRQWQLPGGTVDYGESFDHAIRREVREELGVEVPALRRVTTGRERSHRDLHAIYAAAPPRQSIRLSVEHTEWRYLAVDRLPAPYRQFARLVLAEIATDRSTS
jgi:8-oxo-dGTP pyrophosphatase MutT (NUDIX family)